MFRRPGSTASFPRCGAPCGGSPNVPADTAAARFVDDSPLEGTGFEPSVPRKAPGVVLVSSLGRADFSFRGGSSRGDMSPSRTFGGVTTSESRANLFSFLGAPGVSFSFRTPRVVAVAMAGCGQQIGGEGGQMPLPG